MKLWYFSPASPADETRFSALSARLLRQYGTVFDVTIFAPRVGGASVSNSGSICLFETDTDSKRSVALGTEFALSYDMYLAAKNAIQRCGRPDALLFPLSNAAPYYTLLHRFLESDFWSGCPVFVEKDTDESEEPFYLLPYWWVVQQRDFCCRAASGIVRETMEDTGLPLLSPEAVRQAQQPFAPTEFPFLTVRPQSPVPSAKSVSGLLTIIVPYYNLGATLPQTLESAFAVDYPFCEVLVVDDGSTDPASITILQKMEQKYPQLRVLRQENRGLSYVRNRASRTAHGEYIAFLDADDMVAPDFYRRAIALLKQHSNAAYVSSWLEFFDGQQGYKAYFSSCLPVLLLDNMQCAGCVCRRDIFLAYGQNSEDMNHGMEDHESWINMAEHGYFGINIPEPLYRYRISASSMSAAFSRDANHQRHMELFEALEKKHPALYQEYSTEIYNLLMANGPSYLWPGPSLPHPPAGYIEHSADFWLKELQLARANAENYKNSRSYRLGQLLLHPLLKLRTKE